MQDEQSFFAAIEKQYQNQLPFVVYSRPINSIIKCWLQHDDVLHHTGTFSESGFVFAPFDLKSPAVVFPQSHCQHASIELKSLTSIVSHTQIEDGGLKGKEAHVNLVFKVIEDINKGDLHKVVLSRKEVKAVSTINPLDWFKRLFNSYKNAMVYCWYHPKVGLWLGATPELLFKMEGLKLTAISLAGTLPYKENSLPKWTQKELDEQNIVTQFIAKQIEPFALKTELSEVESVRAGQLWHLKSRLTSQLKAETKLQSVIEALHPTPAVCGLPKEFAKSFILNNENYDREFYTGFLGELNLQHVTNRNTQRQNVENNAYKSVKRFCNFYVNLRCMQLVKGNAHIYVGGGITKDSNPEREFVETQNKAKTISSILG